VSQYLVTIAFVAIATATVAAQDGALKPIYLNSNNTADPAADEKPAPAPTRTESQSNSSQDKDPLETDLKNRRVTVAGTFTGTVGTIELGACDKRGKVYLSAIRLNVRPSRITEALQAIGLAPGKVPVADRANSTATPPSGPKVDVFVQWHVTIGNELTLRRARLEEFFWNRQDDKVLPDGPWLYAGSTFVRDEASGSGLLAADVSGSVASINPMDTSALLYYGGDMPRNDVWNANPNLRPAAGTPCRLIIEPVPDPRKPDDAAGATGKTEDAEEAPTPGPNADDEPVAAPGGAEPLPESEKTDDEDSPLQ
jgi:hypothetical protein